MKMSEPISFVSADVVSRVLNWPPVIESLTQAYSSPHGPATSPPRTLAREGRMWLRTMTAIPPGGRFMGGKMFGIGRKPAVNMLIALFEQASGELRALVDGIHITAFRTAATSAAAMQMLAPKEDLVVAVIGSGQEAHAHVRAINAIRQIKELRVFSPSPEKRSAFAALYAKEFNIKTVASESAEQAVRPATMVIAAARSRDETPTVYADWLDNCKSIISIGSTLPEQRELDASVIAKADFIICDVLEEVLDDTGDMIAAHQAGVDFAKKCHSLNDLLCGKLDKAASNAKLPMFKSVGAGIQDVVIAELAYTLADKAGLLTSLPIEFHMKK